MLHRSLALALVAALGGCVALSEPAIQTGPDADVTIDGLHRVDHVPFGTLYMRPDYAFGSYPRFTLGATRVTVRPGSRGLTQEEIAELTARFDAVARRVIAAGGRIEVEQPAACVARVSLGLLDLDLLDPKAIASQAGTSVVRSFGSITLLLEIEDGSTLQPLLRYGRRRTLEGGLGTGVDPARLAALTTTLEAFARGIEQDFQRALPHLTPAAPLSCEERAGQAPPVGTR
jgi:hypothetical protein